MPNEVIISSHEHHILRHPKEQFTNGVALNAAPTPTAQTTKVTPNTAQLHSPFSCPPPPDLPPLYSFQHTYSLRALLKRKTTLRYTHLRPPQKHTLKHPLNTPYNILLQLHTHPLFFELSSI